MANDKTMTAFSPEIRTGLFYSTLFMSVAVSGLYFAIWLDGKGISATDIGIINSVPVFLMLAVNLVVGRIADRSDDWRTVIVVGSVMTGIAAVGLFWVDGFWGILIVWTLAWIPWAATGPVLDAASLRMTRRNGSSFSAIRAWGTIGYMLTVPVIGFLVGKFGAGIFVPVFVAVSLLRAVVALVLPRFRAPAGSEVKIEEHVAKSAREVFKLWFILPVISWALLFSTMMMLNIFAALVWKGAGITELQIGILLALGAFSEATVMFLFARLAGRFTARHLILIAALVSVVRWGLMAFDPPLWGLVVLQLSHGISFGFGYLGIINFIANWTSEDMSAEAQSLSAVLQQGMSVAAIAGFGILFEMWGAAAFGAAAVVCLMAGFCIFVSLRMKSTKSEVST